MSEKRGRLPGVGPEGVYPHSVMCDMKWTRTCCVLLLAACASCTTLATHVVEVTLRGSGSEYTCGDVNVRLHDGTIYLNDEEHMKTLGDVITFRYEQGRPDTIRFLLHQE